MADPSDVRIITTCNQRAQYRVTEISRSNIAILLYTKKYIDNKGDS
jgi:hypothetical protein